MPVQRLPRYELLLRDLIKQTPPDDSEHPKLSSLLGNFHQLQQLAIVTRQDLKQYIYIFTEAVQSVNKHVNESKKNAELRQKYSSSAHLARRLWSWSVLIISLQTVQAAVID